MKKTKSARSSARPTAAGSAAAKSKGKSVSARDRMRAHRERMKAAGMRPVQHWVPDMRDPKVAARIKREIALLDKHPETGELNAWLDAVLADADWT